MPATKPQLHFFWRGSLLLVVVLATWWWLLVPPSLFLLRMAASVPFALLDGGDAAPPITVGADGDWNLHVPIHAERTGGKPIHSLDFTVPRADVTVFTLPLPVFWALMLAAPELRRHLRALLWGTLALLAFQGLSLLAFAEITAHWIAIHMLPAPEPLAVWLLNTAQHLVVNLLPSAVPVCAALGFHDGLRAELFAREDAGARRRKR